MTELLFAWQWLWFRLASRPVVPHTGAELRDLLERARYELEQGWPEAALDCLGRALRLLERQP